MPSGRANILFLDPEERRHERSISLSNFRDNATQISNGRVKYWEIIADNLSKAGWSWGCVSAVDREGRTIWIADAHRGDGERFVVRADEKPTAFVEPKTTVQSNKGSG